MSTPTITITNTLGKTSSISLEVIPSINEEEVFYGPQRDERPIVIEAAKEALQQVVMELAQQSDRYRVLEDELRIVMEYTPNHSYLHVDQSNHLNYCHTAFYFDENTVLNCITKQCDAIKEFYDSEGSDTWRALRLLQRFANGLKSIKNNYGSYPEFQHSLNELIASCDTFYLDKQSSPIPSNCTVFGLLDYKMESYPKSHVAARLKRDFGERLGSFVATHCLPDKPNIKRELVIGCLFAIATNVCREDITPQRPLEYFRMTPNRKSLIDHFQIPLSPDTFGVATEFIKDFPVESIEAQTVLNEICVYADIASSALWHPADRFHMSKATMYDQLNSFFLNPYEAQLFHTDRYLSFLTTAATALAYLQSCHRNAEGITPSITPLIYQIELLLEDHADKMYKTNREQYVACWTKLRNVLQAAVMDPSFDLMPYYRSLFAHPLICDDDKRKALVNHERVQQSEYLARKVAYWNRYYLSNDYFVDEKGLIKPDLIHCNFRKGTLFPLGNILYEVKEVIHEPGFVCQICMPAEIDSLQFIPVKILFQGTINNHQSRIRDLSRKGPGYRLWESKEGSLFGPQLANLFQKICNTYPEMKFSLEFVGHSLGGADAQNAATFLMEFYTDKICSFMYSNIIEHICGIDIHTFNPAGVPNDTIDRYNANIGSVPKTMIRHHFVQMDAVQATGQGQLGAKAQNMENIEIAEIYNLGNSVVGKHCLYAHTRTDTIIPRKMLDHNTDSESINNYLFGMGHSWSDLSKHAQSIIRERPIVNIAYNSLYLWGISTIQAHLSPFTLLGWTFSHVIDEHANAAKKEVWDSTRRFWHGKQILES